MNHIKKFLKANKITMTPTLLDSNKGFKVYQCLFSRLDTQNKFTVLHSMALYFDTPPEPACVFWSAAREILDLAEHTTFKKWAKAQSFDTLREARETYSHYQEMSKTLQFFLGQQLYQSLLKITKEADEC